MCAEDKSYVGKVVRKHCQLFLNFNKHFDRLDKFFFSNVEGLDDYL